MKKLAAYMFLAILVYAVIYIVLIQGKRSSAEKTSAFCNALAVAMPAAEIEMRIKQQGFDYTVVNVPDSTQTVLMISHADEAESVCKALIENERLLEKQFVLSVF